MAPRRTSFGLTLRNTGRRVVFDYQPDQLRVPRGNGDLSGRWVDSPGQILGGLADLATGGGESGGMDEVVHGPGKPDATGTLGDPIAVGSDIELAAKHLGDGKHIRLSRTDEVGTLLEHLNEIVAEARAKGEQAPNYDLCKVTVPGTNLFCLESKGIERVHMPQFGGQPRPGSKAAELPRNPKNGEVSTEDLFREELKKRGIAVENKAVKANSLKASQIELDGPKVAGMSKAMEAGKVPDAPIFVTRDGYIIDGHHRWASKVAIDAQDNELGDIEMPVEMIDMEIGEALDFANEFTKEIGILPKGLGAAAEGVTAPGEGLVPATDADRAKFKEMYGKPIPPAWKDLHVDFSEGAEAIARGRDEGGKSQTLYSDAYRAKQDRAKYERLEQIFAKAPELETSLATIDGDPTRAVARLMLLEGIRVGSTTEKRGKIQSYGAATLLARHAKVLPNGNVHLAFDAKKGEPVEYEIDDPELTEYITGRLREGLKPEDRLFETDSDQTMEVLRNATGLPGMKNHDLRTLLANRIALAEIFERVPPPPANKAQVAALRKEIAEIVAKQLRNKPAQALKSYINPAVFDALALEKAA